jgi:hypothetical protein
MTARISWKKVNGIRRDAGAPEAFERNKLGALRGTLALPGPIIRGIRGKLFTLRSGARWVCGRGPGSWRRLSSIGR